MKRNRAKEALVVGQAFVILGAMFAGLPFGKQLEAADFVVRLFRFTEWPKL